MAYLERINVDEEGLLVSGEEPARAEHWEIGSEEFLRTWWWAFAGDVVSQTNTKEKERFACLDITPVNPNSLIPRGRDMCYHDDLERPSDNVSLPLTLEISIK